MINEIIIQDWILEKEYLPTPIWSKDKGHNGGHISDFKTAQKCFRVVGTKEQIEVWSDSKDFILDEVFSYDPIKKDSYWDGICCNDSVDVPLPTRKEYNAKFEKDYLMYLKMYKENSFDVLILRTS